MSYKTYRPDTIKIFRTFTESLTFPINIKSIINNNDGTLTLTVCELIHAQPGFEVTIETASYLITAIDDDLNTITVKGTTPITVTTFDLYKPFFFYGHPIQTGMELAKESEVNIPHVPMVYFRPDKDVDNNDITPINKEANGELYFLTKSNTLQWLNEQTYNEGVRPMRRLQEYYVDRMIEQGVSIFDIIPAGHEFSVSDYPKFGVYITEKGTQQNKWTDQLSGCGMPLGGLGIWDDGKCHICC